jgi:signal transduction histidine kinase
MTLYSFLRSRSLALLIPVLLLAQALLRDSRGYLVIALAVSWVSLFVPRRIARQVVPFVALALGAVDFLGARGYMYDRLPAYIRGTAPPVVPWPDDYLLPAAAGFTAVGVWLYFRFRAPGAASLAAAARRLRERAGVSSWTLAAIVPVLVIGFELICGFGRPSPVPALSVLLIVASLAVGLLVWHNPREAAIAALMVLPLMGIDAIAIARHWPQGSDVGMFGVVLVTNEYSAMAVGVQAGMLIVADAFLCWKLLGGVNRTEELSQRVETLTRTRSDVVDSAAAELRRIERDLHDGAQARLVALGMNLTVAERVLKTDPDTALDLVSEARDASSRALTELRALVRGIYPPVLADRGLVDAIRALALDMPLPAAVDADLPGQPELPVASAVYFSVAEALANVTRHAEARGVRVQLTYERGLLRAQVTDDGAGGADPGRGSGLSGVERRLAAFDGILAISSPPGGPTIVVIEVPCALS